MRMLLFITPLLIAFTFSAQANMCQSLFNTTKTHSYFTESLYNSQHARLQESNSRQSALENFLLENYKSKDSKPEDTIAFLDYMNGNTFFRDQLITKKIKLTRRSFTEFFWMKRFKIPKTNATTTRGLEETAQNLTELIIRLDTRLNTLKKLSNPSHYARQVDQTFKDAETQFYTLMDRMVETAPQSSHILLKQKDKRQRRLIWSFLWRIVLPMPLNTQSFVNLNAKSHILYQDLNSNNRTGNVKALSHAKWIQSHLLKLGLAFALVHTPNAVETIIQIAGNITSYSQMAEQKIADIKVALVDYNAKTPNQRYEASVHDELNSYKATHALLTSKTERTPEEVADLEYYALRIHEMEAALQENSN